jgi:hypothetical protein
MRGDERTKVNTRYGTSTSMSYTTSDKDFIDFVESKLWGEHLPLKETMPEEWMVSIGQVRITLESSNMSVTVSVANGYFLAPPRTDSYSLRITMDDSEFTLNTGLSEAIKAKKTEFDEIDHRYAKLSSEVKKTLDQYNSLGALLKDHPEMMAIIPPDIKEKHERKVERKASSKPKPVMDAMGLEFDASLLMSTFVAHKILVGQK